MKRFKSIKRQLRRGNLKVEIDPLSPIRGEITGIPQKGFILKRRTSKGRWINY